MNAELESLGSVGYAVIAVSLLLVGAYGVGCLLTRRLRVDRALVDAALSVAVGLNVIAAGAVAVGMLGLLGGGRSVWFSAALAAIGVAFIARDWKQLVEAGRASRHGLTWVALPAAVIGIVTLGPALCFPTGWDELVYHHELPRRWLADGWPAFYADLPYSGFPSLGEILFWLVAPIERVIAPRLLGWICWALGLWFSYRLLRRRLRSGSAAAVTSALALSSTLLLISANCYVETIQMMDFVALLLVGSQRRASSATEWQRPIFIGILAGGAAAVKLTGLPMIAVACLLFVQETLLERLRWRATVQATFMMIGVALLVCGPFYLRPWLLTGNPFYPYYAEWFTADAATLELSRYHHALGSAFGIRSRAAFLLAPFLLAFDGEIYDGDFGWQLMVLIGLAVLGLIGMRGRRQRAFFFVPLVTFGVLYCFWSFTAQQARFAIGAVMALLLLAAMGLHRLHGRQRVVVLLALVVTTVCSAPWRTAGHYVGSWMSIVGLISKTEYVEVSTDREYLPLVRAIEEHVPRDGKVMLLFEHRGFYLPREHVIGTPFFQAAAFTPPGEFPSAAQVIDVLARERITHVLMTSKPRGPDVAPQWLDRLRPLFGAFDRCIERGELHAVWKTEQYELLEVRDGG